MKGRTVIKENFERGRKIILLTIQKEHDGFFWEGQG